MEQLGDRAKPLLGLRPVLFINARGLGASPRIFEVLRTSKIRPLRGLRQPHDRSACWCTLRCFSFALPLRGMAARFACNDHSALRALGAPSSRLKGDSGGIPLRGTGLAGFAPSRRPFGSSLGPSGANPFPLRPAAPGCALRLPPRASARAVRRAGARGFSHFRPLSIVPLR